MHRPENQSLRLISDTLDLSVHDYVLVKQSIRQYGFNLSGETIFIPTTDIYEAQLHQLELRFLSLFQFLSGLVRLRLQEPGRAAFQGWRHHHGERL